VRRNKPNSEPDNTWLLLAAFNLFLALAFLLLFIIAASVAVSAPAQANEKPPLIIDEAPPVREKAPPPPDVRPYEIPTMRGNKRDFRYVPPVKLAPEIDADEVFNMIVNCFPERPEWGVEVKAVAGARYTDHQNTISTFDTAGLSRYYAGIVAEMPLYSAEEMHKQRTQEYQRRGEVAANVAALLKGLADRQRALRLLGIAESVEARSQYRVHEGIAPAEEQITNLQKVADKVGDLDEANASIVAARLALVGQCRDEVAESVNEYLKEVTTQ
jgi:hypothetical protein